MHPDEEADDEPIKAREEQIIGIFKEHAAGMATADLCRKHSVSDGVMQPVQQGRGKDGVPKTSPHSAKLRLEVRSEPSSHHAFETDGERALLAARIDELEKEDWRRRA